MTPEQWLAGFDKLKHPRHTELRPLVEEALLGYADDLGPTTFCVSEDGISFVFLHHTLDIYGAGRYFVVPPGTRTTTFRDAINVVRQSGVAKPQ